MPRETIGEPLSTLEISSDFNSAFGVRAHHTIKRKPGYPTSGHTYLGLYDSAKEAEAARQKPHAKPWSASGPHGSKSFSQTEADQANKEWLDSTEVVFLKQGEEYHSHLDLTRIHGKNDGAHGSPNPTTGQLYGEH